MMRSLITVILCLCALPLWANTPVTGDVASAPSGAWVSAKAAILMDRQTGMVLWQHNADASLPMASTTKIMTAMVILDHGADKLNEPVTVSDAAFAVPGSSTLAARETLALGDLLKAALIASSNTATYAAGEYLAGDVNTFVGWMNDKAKDLGLQHTHFANTHGLHDPQHYSSARDLAVMTRYALTNYPLIRETIIQGSGKPEAINVRPRGRVMLWNRNKILNRALPGMPGSMVDGVKTGYVKEAGRCLVSSATLNGWQLIAVVLDSPDMFKESQTLLYQGFRRYEWKTYATPQEGASVRVAWGRSRTVPVGAAAVLGAPVPRPEFGGLVEDRLEFQGKRLNAPVKKGQQVGMLVLTRNGQPIAGAAAIALRDVPVAWWIVTAKTLSISVAILLIVTIVSMRYAAVTKAARRRRRRLEATR